MSKNYLQPSFDQLAFSRAGGFVFVRALFLSLVIVLQLLLIVLLTADMFNFSFPLYFASLAFNLLLSLYLVSTKDNPAYKLAWLFFIFLIPPTGGLIYIYNLWSHLPSKKNRQQKLFSARFLKEYQQSAGVKRKIEVLPRRVRQQLQYLSRQTGAPAYDHTQTEYLDSGEQLFNDVKGQLQKAEHFIFLEFFILSGGELWSQIQEILVAKVKQGVEVRLLYDDMGSLLRVPGNFGRQLERLGIKAQAFNRVRPYIQTRVNNRDHRKIIVIDNKVGYIGGANLADEYINLVQPYGHWKDAAVRLSGAGVWSLTLLFLQMWNARHLEDEDLKRYHLTPTSLPPSDGLVLPFGDEPQGSEYVSENVYLNLINKARQRVWITSPYLVIDNELFTALTLAAKNGVDVRIIVPSIPDKWYVRFLSQAFYAGLLEQGVQVFEYLPGFIHSKTLLADDDLGLVGTINLDYRSFYLHFEGAVLMYKTKALKQLEQDLKVILGQSRLVSLESVREVRFSTRVLRSLLRLVAPLI